RKEKELLALARRAQAVYEQAAATPAPTYEALSQCPRKHACAPKQLSCGHIGCQNCFKETAYCGDIPACRQCTRPLSYADYKNLIRTCDLTQEEYIGFRKLTHP